MAEADGTDTAAETARGSAGEVFAIFLRLGLTSFGGPIAHLGYFRTAFVKERNWLSDAAYADLVALCQFLPGPASSQAGFALGWMRAGWRGALAAWTAFTLPSALILLAVALGVAAGPGPLGMAVIDGLKIVAVAIVAHAVWGMARTLTPDARRAAVGLGALALVTVWPGAGGQVAAILCGALLGWMLCTADAPQGHAPRIAVPVPLALGCGALFLALLAGLPLVTGLGQGWAMADAYVRAGALVFGGGHVVLPLLEAATVGQGWMSAETFLAGYGAAQAVPGPLFTFAAYLGAVGDVPPNGVAGAALALVAIFLPGMLILLALLPFWEGLRGRTGMRAAMMGTNAAVVGILAAALYDPVFTAGVQSRGDFLLAATCFLMLAVWGQSSLRVVIVGAVGGVALAALGGQL
ncbi:chromate efflux transporter [Oceanomicrobium pacificus]|uniref:Chromate efflux transporter n=1 Tax=Oceanomicrobium pacificus TaxID=2692916 RepID=A0A6B0TPZ5_9RHOB|nr:chromate efflux transporter [Oceanomicrobium pacificus]MXU66006.1 chromate efflux transporter [Oceanomicrobium pacificus]